MSSTIPLNFVSNAINSLLSNNSVRMTILLIASVFTGYTLYPIPAFLNDMFDTSIVFKYFILFFVLVASIYPLDQTKLILAIGVPVVILCFFEIMRNYQQYLDKVPSIRTVLGWDCPDHEE